MANAELEKYIAEAKEKGALNENIKLELLKHDWSEAEVSEALSPKGKNVGLPPPPVPRFGMWVSFQYIILFICLYVSAVSLGGIFHHGVDKFIPDSLDRTTYGFSRYSNDFLLNGYLAGIIVTFPVFIVLFLILKRQILSKPAVKNIRTRKTLIYLTLVITFIFMISHLIATIYGFLGGNTTLRAIAHLGVTFLVAGSIFIYLLNEVREDRKA